MTAFTAHLVSLTIEVESFLECAMMLSVALPALESLYLDFDGFYISKTVSAFRSLSKASKRCKAVKARLETFRLSLAEKRPKLSEAFPAFTALKAFQSFAKLSTASSSTPQIPLLILICE